MFKYLKALLSGEPEPVPTIYDAIAALEGEPDCQTATAILRTLAMKHERKVK